MKNQTARRPDNQQTARSAQPKRVQTRPHYTKQTAHHVAARRDGKPLIFGWGGHLSRPEKTAIQRRAVWSTIILTVVLIIGVLIAYWININIIVPNQPITTVNGQSIPQADYHKLVGLKAQLEQNKIKGIHGLYAQRDDLHAKATTQQALVTKTKQQVDTLTKQIAALPAGAQRTDLENQLKAAKASNTDAQALYTSYNQQYQAMLQASIPAEEALYNQSQIGTDSAEWLQEDVLIRGWLTKQSNAIQSKIQPTSTTIEAGVNALKAELPKGTTYASVLTTYTISDDDVHTMMALKLRRDNMQTYLASQIVSPARQVEAQAITLSTTNIKDANDILSQLKSGSDFAKLAQAKSVDTNTKSKGGELGWLAKGQYIKDYGSNIGGIVDNWLSDPTRQAGDLSPVLTENGTYHIVKIEQVDPSRPIVDAKLSDLQTNALTAWIQSIKAMPGVKVGDVDQNKLLDPLNMPQSIPASAPSSTSGGASGASSTSGGASDTSGGASGTSSGASGTSSGASDTSGGASGTSSGASGTSGGASGTSGGASGTSSQP